MEKYTLSTNEVNGVMSYILKSSSGREVLHLSSEQLVDILVKSIFDAQKTDEEILRPAYVVSAINGAAHTASEFNIEEIVIRANLIADALIARG